MYILRIILAVILWYELTIQLPSEIVNEKGYKFVFFIASLVITSIMICIFFKEPMQAFVFKYIQTFDMQTFVVKHKEKFVGVFKLVILLIILLILLIDIDRTKKLEENKKTSLN